MKKFFALVLVVTMLAFAGSAMAAVTLTASPANISIMAGGAAQTVTLTAGGVEDNLGPEWTFSLNSGAPSWATLSTGTGRTRTLNIQPGSTVTAGNYTIRATVSCTYQPGVHGGRTTESADAVVTVAVNSQPATPTQPVVIPMTIVETVTSVVTQVKVIATTYVNPITREVFTRVSTQVEVVTRTVTTIRQALAVLVPGLPATVVVMPPSNITVVESPVYTGNVEVDIRNASARLKQMSGGDTLRAIATVPSFRAASSGLQAFDIPVFSTVLYDQTIGMVLSKTTTVIAGSDSFEAADAKGNNEAVFLDSNGNQVTKIPGVKKVSSDPTPGAVTAVFYVEAGKTYDPIFTTTVTSADEATFNSKTGTTTAQSVTVTERVERTVSVYETTTFSPIVPDSAKTLIAAELGIASKDLLTFSYDVARSGDWEMSTEEEIYMLAHDLVEVSKLPALKNVKPGTYVAAISCDNSAPVADYVYDPVLYPNGVQNTASTSGTVYRIVNNKAELLAGEDIYSGLRAYLVVVVNASSVAGADTDVEAAAVTLSRPTIAVTANNIRGVGGSSGGCSAGSAVLALAVLGTFIAARKK